MHKNSELNAQGYALAIVHIFRGLRVSLSEYLAAVGDSPKYLAAFKFGDSPKLAMRRSRSGQLSDGTVTASKS